jgi:serine/threonine protein kinase
VGVYLGEVTLFRYYAVSFLFWFARLTRAVHVPPVTFLRALHELRAADVVHCDIKPPNMLLSRTSQSAKPHSTSSRGKKLSSVVENRLKLIDFGEANETIKADRIEVGTPGYMAPEVLTDGDCTSSSDVYSAGVTLIEVWHGGLWAGAETRGEGSEGMRREVLDVSHAYPVPNHTARA